MRKGTVVTLSICILFLGLPALTQSIGDGNRLLPMCCDFCVRVRAEIEEGRSKKDEQNRIAEDFLRSLSQTKACEGKILASSKAKDYTSHMEGRV